MRKWTKAQKQQHSEALKAAWVKRKARQAPTKVTPKVTDTIIRGGQLAHELRSLSERLTGIAHELRGLSM